MIELAVRRRPNPHSPGGNRLGHFRCRPGQEFPAGRVHVEETHVVPQYFGGVSDRVETDGEKLDSVSPEEALRPQLLLNLTQAMRRGRARAVAGREHEAHEQDLALQVVEMQRLAVVSY